jgi:hypothetical protein
VTWHQRSPGLIDREDLFAALDSAVARKVTVISAPADILDVLRGGSLAASDPPSLPRARI